MDCRIPKTQSAVQLVGADKLVLNTAKQVLPPGPYQVLAKVRAAGLCFSDLKLLKQFTSHARKGPVISGINPSVLDEIPCYVPGEKPAVPGHEAEVCVVAVGDKVKGIEVGKNYLVQTDYRWLATNGSNAAFGYNFEGALQQYVLMDQRVITSPQGRSMLIEASDSVSASAVALVEPWACVEDAYAVSERTAIKTGGRMLVVADKPFDTVAFEALLAKFGRPAQITFVGDKSYSGRLPTEVIFADTVEAVADAMFDDVIYYGAEAAGIESVFPRIAPSGLCNIVLCGGSLAVPVNVPVGRVHYGNIRIIGTSTSDPADAMRHIPASGRIRTGEKINIVGAAGPMGLMHVMRNICQGVKAVEIFAGDLDDNRLAALTKIAQPAAQTNGVSYIPYNPSVCTPGTKFSYTVVMAPVPKLVCDAVANSGCGGIINIFAGIPAQMSAPIDLGHYISSHLYFIGTSGSTLDDMITVLGKVESGSLDTNISVAAVCGLDGAIDGIRAMERHAIAGKIIVYPACRNLPLTMFNDLGASLPDVARCLNEGLWTKQAEEALLDTASEKNCQ